MITSVTKYFLYYDFCIGVIDDEKRSHLRMNLICFPLGYGFTITLNLTSNLPLEWQYLMGLSHPLIVPLKSFPTFFKANHYGHSPSSHGHIHIYIVLLNNLNPCLNYNFHFIGIKKLY
jgi:hypothetical protein